jgi:phage terminase small subunit
MTRLASEHIKLVNELGLTPASRGKLTLPEGEEKKQQAASLASIVESMKRNE